MTGCGGIERRRAKRICRASSRCAWVVALFVWLAMALVGAAHAASPAAGASRSTPAITGPAPQPLALQPLALQPLAPQPSLAFTPQERAWITAHPVVRFAASSGLPPYYEFGPEASQPHGFVIEVLGLMAERAGLRFEYVRRADVAGVRAAVLAGEADAAPFVAPPLRPQASDGLLHLQPMISANLVLVVRRDIPDISPASQFGGYRVAVHTGSAADRLMQARFPQARTLRYADPGEAVRAVASGDADIHIGYRQVAVYYVEKYLMANLQVRGTLGPGVTGIGPAVRQGETVLQGILDKALASVTQRERARLAQSWLPPGAMEDDGPRSVVLSDAERAWLEANGRIRVAYDAAFQPITFQTDLTQMRGLGADFIRLAAGKAGLSIVSETGDSFAESYRRGTLGEIDVLVGAMRTTERRAHYDFVGPFLRVPTGIVTRSEHGLLLTKLDEAGRHRLALLEEHFLIPQLRIRYPMLQLLTFPTQNAVLDAVADGRADLGIGNLKVVNQLINDRYTGRVRVTGTVPEADSELYFAVRRDLPELSQLLRKGLDAVSEAEAADIERRWLVVVPTDGLTWAQALRIAAVGTAVLLLLLTYLALLQRGNRRLRLAREIEREARRVAEEATTARGRFIGYLTHELRGTMGGIVSGADLLKDPTPSQPREKLVDAIQASAQGFLGLLESVLLHEQQLERPIELDREPADLAVLWPQMLAPCVLNAQAKRLVLVHALQVDAGATSHVRVDVPRLRQVVNNLVGNAIKFTSEGDVRVNGRMGLVHGVPTLTLEVVDNGPGLTEEDSVRLFQAYAQGTQGKRLRQGAGLGLAITRQIVLAMGGTIEAGPAPGGGARFLTVLPMA